MKVYGTIDENGVDGFSFNERDKNIRMLRARLNEWKRLARFVRKKTNKRG